MKPSNDVGEIASLLRKTPSVLFITGAGLSADSGLPTYRGVGGLYEEAHTEEGFPIEVALSGSMFQNRPEITWKYLWQIGEACAGVEPNGAHHFMARMEREKPHVCVLTQNVDGLHRKAGTRNLIEAHGHGFDLHCTRCKRAFHADELINGYQQKIELPPRCPDCHGVIRPDIVLFEEQLPEKALKGLDQMDRTSYGMIFSVGTSLLFPYIADPIFSAYKNGIPCVEINPSETDMSDIFSHRLEMTAAAAMEAIDQQLRTGLN